MFLILGPSNEFLSNMPIANLHEQNIQIPNY